MPTKCTLCTVSHSGEAKLVWDPTHLLLSDNNPDQALPDWVHLRTLQTLPVTQCSWKSQGEQRLQAGRPWAIKRKSRATCLQAQVSTAWHLALGSTQSGLVLVADIAPCSFLLIWSRAPVIWTQPHLGSVNHLMWMLTQWPERVQEDSGQKSKMCFTHFLFPCTWFFQSTSERLPSEQG